MAFWGITVEEIGSIEPIVGADKIVKASLKNVAFSFVVAKDMFKVDEKVLYFPIDSLIPTPVQEKLGVVGRLAGCDKNRIKTVKLRGVLSQGLVGKMSILIGSNLEECKLTTELITEYLGVTKYEPPVIPDKAGNLKPLPNNLSIYDIEGCERNYVPLEKLMDTLVWVLEKLEGSNGSVSYDPIAKVTYVNQRRHTIEEIVGHEHQWWSVARKQKFIDMVTYIGESLMKPATIYFEVIGPGWQGNIYKLSEVEGRIFDIKIGEDYVEKRQMFWMLDNFFGAGNYKHAPVISKDITLREWLNGRTIVEASHGESLLYKTLREGIVITPDTEQTDETLKGRLILKQRDPIYLAGTDN